MLISAARRAEQTASNGCLCRRGNSTASISVSEKANLRAGQATRQGHIVIAPRWGKDHQQAYEYSTREHAAVLFSLRDAMQKFAADSSAASGTTNLGALLKAKLNEQKQ